MISLWITRTVTQSWEELDVDEAVFLKAADDVGLPTKEEDTPVVDYIEWLDGHQLWAPQWKNLLDALTTNVRPSRETDDIELDEYAVDD